MSFLKYTGYNKIKWNLKNVTKKELLKHDKKEPLHFPPISIELDGHSTDWACIAIVENESLSVHFGILNNNSLSNFDIEIIMTINEIKLELKKSSIEFSGKMWGCRIISLANFFDQSKNYVNSDREATIEIQIILTAKEPFNANHRLINNDNSVYFNQNLFSDFTLVCSDDVEIPVHRVYLALQSPVFKTMFEIEMSEQNEKKALINDIDSTVMKEVIYYIYTGQLRVCISSTLINIIYAAEKYKLNGLKSWCIDELYREVKNDNVLDIFLAANLYDIKKLEDRCLGVIMGNYKNLEDEIAKMPGRLIVKITNAFAESSSIKFETTFPLNSIPITNR